MLTRSLGMGLLLALLAGCGVQHLNWNYICDDPEPNHRGPNGEFDPCHEQDVDVEASCEIGQYVHWAHGWDSPSWVWIGPEEEAPECPYGSTSVSYVGRADLVAPSVCEACTCDPPTGSCALPSKLTASTAACGAPGGVSTSFNAPDPWDGSCDGSTQAPGGAAHSLTIDPLVMTENGCAPGLPVPAKIVSLHWDTFALSCDFQLPVGPIERSTCLTQDPVATGFKSCIFHEGERNCPVEDGDDAFTERHVFYQGVQDDRQCSTCTCGAPAGSACKAQLSVHEDASCGTSPLVSIPISSTTPACFDIALPGQALGSKSVSAVTYLPGTCSPMGGVASGSATMTEPATFCCRP